LNQFTSTSSFIANGQIITIKTESFELQGSNFISKIFCGIANWFGHIMSDIAGSSGGRGNNGRGAGVVVPFYELFQFCKFGKFNVGKDRQDLSTIAIRAFQEGYDFRFGMATALPVVITDLSIRLVWSIRRYFHFEYALKDCIPTRKHDTLRVMLIVGNGTLCLMDGMDAAIRSGGNMLLFFTRLNIIAWFRFAMLVLKEVFIRIGVSNPLQKNIEAFKRINEALNLYMRQLEQLDIELFKKETEEYNRIANVLWDIYSEEKLNAVLYREIENQGIPIPWKGDFDEHMSDKNARLVFE
jgi:hypothetical protein